MLTVALDRLLAHPENANAMPEDRLAILTAHIESTGRYPPLIVRPHPTRADCYELLDGHHRAEALRRLGHREAKCIVWEADDQQARLLLLTLNRLQGKDDPHRRGALLQRLCESVDLDALAAKLPDDRAQIESLIALQDSPPPPAPPTERASMPEAITFFLSPQHRRALLARLGRHGSDRSAALVKLLQLDQAGRH